MGLIDHQTNSISERVIGAAIEVHRPLRSIIYRSQAELPLEYKGVETERGYVIDLLIEDNLIIEIKSVEKLLPIHSSQLLTYMKLKKLSAGLLINFNVETLLQGLRRILR